MHPSRPPRSETLILVGLLALGVIPALAGVIRVAEVATGAPVTPENARFLAAPVPVVLHVLAAIPFSFLGAFQLAPTIRRRFPAWHRGAGGVLAALGMVVAITGIWMAHRYPWPDGDGEGLYLLRILFGGLMAGSIMLALRALLRREFRAHGAWMLRGYAIGMGAGTQVVLQLPWLLLFGAPGQTARTLLMGAGWVINLAAAEWALRRRLPSAFPPTRPPMGRVPVRPTPG